MLPSSQCRSAHLQLPCNGSESLISNKDAAKRINLGSPESKWTVYRIPRSGAGTLYWNGSRSARGFTQGGCRSGLLQPELSHVSLELQHVIPPSVKFVDLS